MIPEYWGAKMTVSQLIAHLQTLPQDLPVTGYCADESTGWVSPEGIQIKESEGPSTDLYTSEGKPYNGQHLDIMGF